MLHPPGPWSLGGLLLACAFDEVLFVLLMFWSVLSVEFLRPLVHELAEEARAASAGMPLLRSVGLDNFHVHWG